LLLRTGGTFYSCCLLYNCHWLGSLCRKVLKFKHCYIKMSLIALTCISNSEGCSGNKLMLPLLFICVCDKNSSDICLIVGEAFLFQFDRSPSTPLSTTVITVSVSSSSFNLWQPRFWLITASRQ